ncbi:MAG: DUF6491 family protein [Pseudomonadales bacterium]
MQLTARVGRTISRYGFSLLACIMAASASALPPTDQDPGALLRAGEPVSSISMANGIAGFQPLDDEHVMLSLGTDQHYLLTLNRECHGLRWARHVGVTVSDNTIWAGFDALTADGAACPIREIHLVRDLEPTATSR